MADSKKVHTKRASEEAAKMVEATPYQFKITGAPPGSIEVIDTSKAIAAAIRGLIRYTQDAERG
jgi:hypothetical protein